jgi:hypothetical protein
MLQFHSLASKQNHIVRFDSSFRPKASPIEKYPHDFDGYHSHSWDRFRSGTEFEQSFAQKQALESDLFLSNLLNTFTILLPKSRLSLNANISLSGTKFTGMCSSLKINSNRFNGF